MSLEIRALRADEFEEAERIMRSAFGTFVGLPEPEQFGGDSSFVRSRAETHPDRAFAALLDGELVGSNFATRWGRFAFFGPLSIRPDCWDRGFATPLMEPVLDAFSSWDLRGSGLFTFPHSPKHIGLYQKFGFRPATLSVVFEHHLDDDAASVPAFVSDEADPEVCRAIAGAVSAGLDLSEEIEAATTRGLGGAFVTPSGAAFAVCHVGPGSEAGSERCYVKFAAVRPGPDAGAHFEELLDQCEAYARSRGVPILLAGVNVGRRVAYDAMLARGYPIDFTGIVMHRPGPPEFCGPNDFVINDWR